MSVGGESLLVVAGGLLGTWGKVAEVSIVWLVVLLSIASSG